jgi:hypothetical protein
MAHILSKHSRKNFIASKIFTLNKVVIMVVDSTDKDRIGITKEELFRMLNHEV